jgi:hypothetical protein
MLRPASPALPVSRGSWQGTTRLRAFLRAGASMVALWPLASSLGPLAFSLGPARAEGQSPPPPIQTQADDYTRYELLAPGSAKFRILYDVTATTAGATRFFNAIRRGSVATDERVLDRATGMPLRFEVVNGAVARSHGVRGADSTGEYIMVHLARPVPDSGEARLLIDKTYEDARSYLAGGDSVVFTRPLGIKRNSVVLPAGYELVSVNYPSQIRTEADGRIAVSFINIGPAEVPYVVKGRQLRLEAGGPRSESAVRPSAPAAAAPSTAPPPAASSAVTPSRSSRLSERAHQDREIVYFLQQPETHAFDLYHDYTEARVGVDKYINVVRTGSTVSRPSARILDTGESLPFEIFKGAQITAAKLDIGEAVRPETEIVVIRFPPVRQGQSVRLRISETYTDPARYRLDGDELLWDRSFGRPANAVVLAAGWYVTNSSIPATVSLMNDGRVRLNYMNARNDNVDVLLTARRRP